MPYSNYKQIAIAIKNREVFKGNSAWSYNSGVYGYTIYSYNTAIYSDKSGLNSTNYSRTTSKLQNLIRQNMPSHRLIINKKR